MKAGIIEKLKKILTLAGDKAASPGEIESAMARARVIAIRHSIDIAAVNDWIDEEKVRNALQVEYTYLHICSKYERPYHRYILAILREVFEVETVMNAMNESGKRHVFGVYLVGEATDIAIASAILPFLENVFPKTFSNAVRKGVLRNCVADRNGCYYGLYEGILGANRRVRANLNEQEENTYALVVANKDTLIQAKLEEEFPGTKYQKSKIRKWSRLARGIGKEEGKKINLNQVGV